MRFMTKWATVAIGGSLLVAAGLLIFPAALDISVPARFDPLVAVIFWPVLLCEHLVGAGPQLGPSGRQMMEGTPVHAFAAAVGVGVSWMFWSSAGLIALR